MLEALQNGGRKFNLNWLRGFPLGLCKDPWAFCGTNASRSLLWDSGRWSTQKTTKTPSACHCKPPLSFCWKQALIPHHPGSDRVRKRAKLPSPHPQLSHTQAGLSHGCSPPRMPAQTTPPPCPLRQLSSTWLQNGARVFIGPVSLENAFLKQSGWL